MAENLPNAAAERILRKTGNGRVADDASEALSELLESVGTEIARTAGEIAAKDNGRKTVKGVDIRKAAKEVWE